MIDVIVVGSGPGGVNSAYPLCEAGLNVLMLDFGNTDTRYGHLVPSKDFTDIRNTDEHQHRYFLGDDYEGILLGNVRVGTKLTPPRLHVVADSGERMPVDSDSFVANESLALGGLAAGWGAGVIPFHESDFSGMPISSEDLAPHYKAVAERVGVSGDMEGIRQLFDDFGPVMPPRELDSNAESMMKRFIQKREQFNMRGFFLGPATMAITTQPHRDRGPHQYHDMDFWTDTDDSVYRPRYTLGELKRFANFSYEADRFVLSFSEEEENTVEVTVRVRGGSTTEQYHAHAVVLAAGTMGSARIALRSLSKFDVRIPILTNAYTYIPSINVNMIGKAARDRRSSLTQLHLYHFPDSSHTCPVLSSLFSYRSLLTFKLLKEAPLPQRECLRIMRTLMNVFVIATIFHKDEPTDEKYCVLRKAPKGEPDHLEIQYRHSRTELEEMNRIEKTIKRFYRELGCWPIKSIRRAPGSSIHYSGTLPMSAEEREMTCTTEGRLAGTRSVYVADGSLISPLPSIAPTFSIMALANRVGTLLGKKLKQ
jgi:choline dehydrogenase-like flavoprotein